MITMKDANSIWLESIALFQTVLAETVNEWGKAEDEEMMGVLNKVVNIRARETGQKSRAADAATGQARTEQQE